MEKNGIEFVRKAVAVDWRRDHRLYTARAACTPGLPFLGVLIGGGVSLLLWVGLSVSAWALLTR